MSKKTKFEKERVARPLPQVTKRETASCEWKVGGEELITVTKNSVSSGYIDVHEIVKYPDEMYDAVIKALAEARALYFANGGKPQSGEHDSEEEEEDELELDETCDDEEDDEEEFED